MSKEELPRKKIVRLESQLKALEAENQKLKEEIRKLKAH